MGKLSKIAILLCIGALIFALAACDGFIPGDDTAPTDNTEIGEHDHVFTEIIIKEATCTEDGQKDLVCDICGYTETHYIWLGHQYEELPDKAPNCTEAGWENHQKCSVCGDEFRNDLEIRPNVHVFDADGICTFCGKNAYEGIKFSLSANRNYYTVVGVENKQIYEIWIPAQYEGKAVKVIGNNAFYECLATKLVLPDTITDIQEGAFSGCYFLTEINLPAGVTTIGNSAFSTCSSLTEIHLPEGVTTIENSAFSGCYNLTEINIPESVTKIGFEVFRDCKGLTTIDIPDGVTVLGDRIFSGCSGLTSITLGKGIKELGRFAFEQCSSLKDVIVEVENPNFKVIGGALYSMDGTVLYLYGAGNTAASFTVPAEVKTIATAAFACNEALTSVTLPEGLTHIHEYAFSGCNNLAAINLPETLQYIGDDALAYTALTKVVIPDSVTYVGSWCFLQCQNLTSLTIGTGVTRLGGQVVCWCDNLTELIFRDPNNWRVDMMHVSINPDQLSTSAYAITTLKVSYCQNSWYKLTEE